jgi:hypothetical protein
MPRSEVEAGSLAAPPRRAESTTGLRYNNRSFSFPEVNMSLRKMFGKTILCAMLAISLLAGVATPARADRDDKCQRDIHRAEENLEKAVHKHGEHSRQAEDRRRQLEEVRERCRAHDHDHDHH